MPRTIWSQNARIGRQIVCNNWTHVENIQWKLWLSYEPIVNVAWNVEITSITEYIRTISYHSYRLKQNIYIWYHGYQLMQYSHILNFVDSSYTFKLVLRSYVLYLEKWCQWSQTAPANPEKAMGFVFVLSEPFKHT